MDALASWFRTSQHPMSRKRRLLILRTYLPDWVITIVLWGLFYLLDRVNGFRRQFDVYDASIQHTFTEHERITGKQLFLICLLAPLIIILFVSVLWKRSLWDWHSGWLGLVLSLAVTSTATNIIKITVGRPRPDLLARCQLPAGINNPGPPNFGLTTWYACTRTDLLNDGFRSFPSGHSSLSWCGMWYLTMYLAGKMHVYDKKGMSFKTWVLLIPISAAALTAISRSMDYRHHVGDIIAGSLLGLLIGWYSYRQYYPALDHPLCDKPYGPRIPKEEGEHVDTEAQGLRTEERHDVALLQTNGNSARGRNTVNGGPSGSEAAQTVPVEHGHDTLMDSRDEVIEQ